MKFEQNKHWNLFSDDKGYKTNFFLDFNRPSLNHKYEKDTYIRLRYTTKTIILLYLVVYIWYSLFYSSRIQVWNIICYSLGTAYAFYYHQKFGIKSRLAMVPPITILQYTLVKDYNSSLILVLLVILPIDIGTVFTWRNHVISLMSQNMILLLISYAFPNLVHSE